ncbi:MAG: diaminopimelate epimerase [Porticoccaceae bacterium]|nr:diaminopimelate epimerase [Porticoccaceae bacterium]
MLIKFTKMHGLGNDFVVIDAVRQQINLTTNAIKRLADRNLGIGCDQVLLIEPPTDKSVDFNYRIFNCDGSEVEQCGNGARCMGQYIADQQLSGKKSVLLKTKNRVMEVTTKAKNLVTANMGAPIFTPADIPFTSERQDKLYPIEAESQNFEIAALSIGNPHAVIQVEDINTVAVNEIGPLIQAHTQFPESVNVGFMQIIDRQTIKLRVYERGVGETQACGSGACAAAVAAIQQNLVDASVNLKLLGGSLSVEWQGDDEPILMTGPAETVFHGKIKL